jgi:rhodanese-related sulfurtransferase
VNFPSVEQQGGVRGRTGRQAVAALAVGLAMLLGTGACGSDDSRPAPTAARKESRQQAAAFTRLDPEQFAARMTDGDAQVINVHIPYEGELEHTDAFVPFDRIVGDSRLPADKDSELLLYCKTGRMSVTAGEALDQAGYTNVSHLEGGMKAWEAAGKPLIHKPQEGQPAGSH